MQFPRTLLEFQAQFPDEASCWAHLRKARWPRGFLCPRCGSRGSHFIASRRLEQCRVCRYQGSVTAGTVFHGTRVALQVWFLGIFFLARHKKGISARQFQRDTGLGSYRQPGPCSTRFVRRCATDCRTRWPAWSRSTKPMSAAQTGPAGRA